MNKGRRRRVFILAASHLVAGVMGVLTVLYLAARAGPFASGSRPPALWLAWILSTTNGTSCKEDLTPWARTLAARRQDLAEEDFAVEAAITLALLRDHGGGGLPASERRTLQDAAGRCPSVLHAPCEGPAFARAVADRCSPPRGHGSRTDSGADAGAVSSGDGSL